MSRREKMFAVLPTLMTCGNAFCGFAAITYAAKVGPDPAEGNGAHLLTASLCIFLGMLFDALDGRVARWANQTSEFGAQLDSLCDAVSFGVAPAFLMIQFCVHYDSGYHSRVLWMIGALFAVCAILRLARFTIESDEEDSHDFFSGLPSPAAAGTIAAFPIAMRGVADLIAKGPESLRILARDWLTPAAGHLLPVITLATACLMVSRLRYPHVFNQLFTGRRSRAHVIQVIFTVAVVFIVQEGAVPLIFGYFAFAAPVKAFWAKFILPRFSRTEHNAPAEQDAA